MSNSHRRNRRSCVLGITISQGVAEIFALTKTNAVVLEGYFSEKAGLSIAVDRPAAVIAAPADTFDDERKEELRQRGHMLIEIDASPAEFLGAKECAFIAAKKIERRQRARKLANANRIARVQVENAAVSFGM